MIRLVDVERVYRQGAVEVPVLRGVSLEIAAGSFVAITGPSGSGKSTMLHLLGALDRPSRGEVWIESARVDRLDDDARTRLRRDRLAFVFQFFNLLPTLTALENVCLPALLAGRSQRELTPKATALLETVGIAHRARHRPHELSGGEMQRVALARALIHDPAIVLADEPTGNLDSTRGREVLELLKGMTQARGKTVVMVTHDPKVADYADRVIELADGRVRADR